MKLVIVDAGGRATVVDLEQGPALLYCETWGDWRVRVRTDGDVECYVVGHEEQGTRVAMLGGHDA